LQLTEHFVQNGDGGVGLVGIYACTAGRLNEISQLNRNCRCGIGGLGDVTPHLIGGDGLFLNCGGNTVHHVHTREPVQCELRIFSANIDETSMDSSIA